MFFGVQPFQARPVLRYVVSLEQRSGGSVLGGARASASEHTSIRGIVSGRDRPQPARAALFRTVGPGSLDSGAMGTMERFEEGEMAILTAPATTTASDHGPLRIWVECWPGT